MKKFIGHIETIKVRRCPEPAGLQIAVCAYYDNSLSCTCRFRTENGVCAHPKATEENKR